MIQPFALDYARAGWLRSPWGTVRHIRGIDRLAADTLYAGASVWWDTADGAQAGRAIVSSRQIVLAAWLFPLVPFIVRRVWAEELAHVHVGLSDAKAVEWRQRYGDLLEPVRV